MKISQLNPGDVVYAAAEIRNDGGIPHLPADAVLATPGTRGVIMNIGYLEQAPERDLFLVRFEDEPSKARAITDPKVSFLCGIIRPIH